MVNYRLIHPIKFNIIFAIVIGVLSTFASIYPTILSLKKEPTPEKYKMANLEDKIYQMAIGYSIIHIFIFYFVAKLLPNKLNNYWILGLIMAFVFPTLGTVTGYAKKMYGIQSTLKLYLGAQLMYLPLYGFLFSFISQNICK